MRCPKCNYNNRDGSAVCNLCGELLHTTGASYKEKFKQIKKAQRPPMPKISKAAPPAPVTGAGAGSDPRALKYHLVCFPLDPVELQVDVSYSIGRSGDNDIIFPVGQVSRKHAEVIWEDGGFTLADLGSHNGTFVNAEKIEKRRLSHGDQIKIGPYLMEFYITRPGQTASLAAKGSMDATQDLGLGDNYEVGPFSGRLSEIELRDIARLLNMTHKTGRLEVTTPAQVGEIHFLEGEIVDAKWGKLPAMHALANMLVEKDGSFRFLRDSMEIRRVLEGPTSKILIDALRLGSQKG
ncbi:MAG: FHA domain-containing protein [Planctomycetota bacterium]|jgi:pSer/pThr/pTyr-binding forkhead associated (FHA) protein